MEKQNCREVALNILLECEEKYLLVNQALTQGLAHNPLNDKDRALCTELVNGTIRWRKKLDWFLSQFVDYPIAQLSLKLVNILRLAFYQKIFLDKIPDHAMVNEAVEMTKKYEPAASGLVNAVLRKFIMGYADISLPAEAENPVGFLALKYSYPEWLIEYWYQHHSRHEIRAICEANNLPAPLTIRVNQLRTTPAELAKRLEAEAVKATSCNYAPAGLTVKTKQALTALPSYQQGLFTIQGETSMLISMLLAPAKDSVVFDFCAGGGGKTSHLAQIMENTGQIVAFELEAKEVKRLQSNLERLGVKNVEAHVADLTHVDAQWLRKADYILVDAPCSGLGTIRRYADARWHKSPALIEEMAGLQTKIMDTAAQYLKPGGRLVYAVCTNTFEENEMVVSRFLNDHPKFAIEELKRLAPASWEKLIGERIYFKSQPQRDNLDGFFAVSLHKKGSN